MSMSDGKESCFVLFFVWFVFVVVVVVVVVAVVGVVVCKFVCFFCFRFVPLLLTMQRAEADQGISEAL
jgi:hypothetical protein